MFDLTTLGPNLLWTYMRHIMPVSVRVCVCVCICARACVCAGVRVWADGLGRMYPPKPLTSNRSKIETKNVRRRGKVRIAFGGKEF